MNYADEIKHVISVPQVLSKYVAIEPKRNRLPCPIHHGKNYNFAFKDDMFKCFSCGENGDVIKLVMCLFGIDFQQAIFRLNYDFGLNLPIGKQLTIREKQAANQRLKEIELTRLIKKKKEERDRIEVDIKYWWRIDEYNRLKANQKRYAPKSYEDKLHPLFLEAIHNINQLSHEIDILEEEKRWIS